MHWLFELKKKSIDTKRRFALVVSGIITGIIFVSWFMIWREVQAPQSTVKEYSESKTTSINPWTALSTVFSDGYTVFKNEFAQGEDPWKELGEKMGNFASTTGIVFATSSEMAEIDATTTASTTEGITASTTNIE